MKNLRHILAAGFILISCIGYAQKDSVSLFQKRKKIVVIGGLANIAITHIGLNQLWYKDYPRSSFHFINDNDQWMQMDKMGHMYSSYYLGIMGIKAAQWAGYSRKKAIWMGGLYGTLFQTPIEIQDGFSEKWGASMGDIVANSLGTTLAIAQELKWDEQRIQLKYSFSSTNYASIRPNTLGDGITQEFLKDYNGQTYWLSTNISSFLNQESKFPKWLNFAVGYGADGMIGGEDNLWEDAQGIHYDYSHIPRKRQFYIAPDINFSKIKTNRKGVKLLFVVLNAIKFPAPTIEFQSGESKFHWLKF